MKSVNILGTEYKIIVSNETLNPKLKNNNGLCEQYSKEIIIDDLKECENEVMLVDNIQEYKNKVLRHEVIHAFLGESGLRSESKWAESEEMVDWWANQLPKIFKTFQELKIL